MRVPQQLLCLLHRIGQLLSFGECCFIHCDASLLSCLSDLVLVLLCKIFSFKLILHLVFAEPLTVPDKVFPLAVIEFQFPCPTGVVLLSTLIFAELAIMMFATFSENGAVLHVTLGVTIISLDRWIWFSILTKIHLMYPPLDICGMDSRLGSEYALVFSSVLVMWLMIWKTSPIILQESCYLSTPFLICCAFSPHMRYTLSQLQPVISANLVVWCMHSSRTFALAKYWPVISSPPCNRCEYADMASA